jgi:hypothetical protein
MPADSSVTRIAISISINTLIANWPVSYVTITGNSIQKAGTVAKGWGVYLDGVTVSPNDGQPITVEHVNITNNTFGDKLAIALVLGQQAKYNAFYDNIVDCGQEVVDLSGGSAFGNVFTSDLSGNRELYQADTHTNYPVSARANYQVNERITAEVNN